MSPTAELAVEQLPVEKLSVAFNAKVGRVFDAVADEADAELVASIKGSGVHVPLQVRVDPLDGGLWQVLDGSRRARAAAVAGLATVPALVHADLSDAEAWELWYAANFQRKDLSPVQEGTAVDILLERFGGDVEAVAAKLGHTTRWVVQRRALKDLSSDWQKWAAMPGCPWGIGHLLEIARMPASVQAQMFEDREPAPDGDWDEAIYTTVADLRGQAATYMHSLTSAPWKLDAATGDNTRPACTACPNRTGACGELFLAPDAEAADIEDDDRCLDPVCWQAKFEAAANAVLQGFADEGHEQAIVVVAANLPCDIEWPDSIEVEVVENWKVDDCEGNEADAVPALFASRRELRTGWAKVRESGVDRTITPGRAKGTPTPLKERRTNLEKKRTVEVLERLRALVEETTPYEARAEKMTLERVVTVAMVFGTQHRHDCNGYGPPNVKRWTLLAKQEADYTGAVGAQRLWNAVVPVLQSRLEWKGSIIHLPGEFVAEAKHIAELVGVDFDGLVSAVAEAMPEPKSWAKLNADGTPKAKKGGKK